MEVRVLVRNFKTCLRDSLLGGIWMKKYDVLQKKTKKTTHEKYEVLRNNFFVSYSN